MKEENPKTQLEQRIEQFRVALSSQGKYPNWECLKGMIYRVEERYGQTDLRITPKDEDIQECFGIPHKRNHPIVYACWNRNWKKEIPESSNLEFINLNPKQGRILKPLREYIKWLAVA